MLAFLRGKASDRKWLLLDSACVRLIWSLACEEAPSAVSTAEDFADGSATKAALKKARASMRRERHCVLEFADCLDEKPEAAVRMRQKLVGYRLAEVAASERSHGSVLSELMRLGSDLQDVMLPESDALAGLFRDIFGNPFRPVTTDPRWLTSTAVSLATGIYQDRAFDRLPILADALEDAGCNEPALLEHCRSDSPHVRGC